MQVVPVICLPQLPFAHLMPGAQSASDAQRVTQALVEVSQPNGAQIFTAPATQLPAPSQVRIPPTEAPLHVPGWQTVPATYARQPPFPSHAPSSPQVDTALLAQTPGERGGSPAATKLQVPGAAIVLHDLQVSVQAVLQQTPSTQNPLVQSAPQAHAFPFGLGVPPSRPQAATSPPPSIFTVGGCEDE